MAKDSRQLFIPKLPERSDQCGSCPFREDNDAQFTAFIWRVAFRVTGIPIEPAELEPTTARARRNVHYRIARRGEYRCHLAAYDRDMSLRPVREHRQCPGATDFYIHYLDP